MDVDAGKGSQPVTGVFNQHIMGTRASGPLTTLFSFKPQLILSDWAPEGSVTSKKLVFK